MAVEYLGSGSDDGTLLGRSSTDKLGFYGTSTPVAKQTCTLAAALTAGTTTPANIAAAVDELHAALAAAGIIA
jgi:hypothetical protein